MDRKSYLAENLVYLLANHKCMVNMVSFPSESVLYFAVKIIAYLSYLVSPFIQNTKRSCGICVTLQRVHILSI